MAFCARIEVGHIRIEAGHGIMIKIVGVNDMRRQRFI